jgi:hypothetical protein
MLLIDSTRTEMQIEQLRHISYVNGKFPLYISMVLVVSPLRIAMRV